MNSATESSNHSARNPFLESSLASRYESWYTGPGRLADQLEKRLLRRMIEKLGPVQSVLEIGCGTGHFTRWLRSLKYEVCGVDSSPAMLEQAFQLNGGHYVQGNALSLPFPDRSFDVAALITTLEFVPDPE